MFIKSILSLMLTALVICPLTAKSIIVKDFGAIGDGKADDTAAIIKAINNIKSENGGEIVFPAGQYRIAAKVRGGIVLDKVSNVTITFQKGAVLLMDNLRSDGLGGGHGVLVTGPSKNIKLSNVTVQWKTRPRARSCGDGFRFEGFPKAGLSIDGITMTDCKAENSAQTGAVLMGCENITVKDFVADRTWADGLHFNSCRNINVDGIKGIATCDDTLAFVTYYHKEKVGRRGRPFAQSKLNDWSNTNTVAVNIFSNGGRANGIRIAGAMNVSISNINISKKSSGIIIDSGMKDKRHRWAYLPSQVIKIDNAKINNCDTGLLVENFSHTDRTRQFEINCKNLEISKCRNDGIHLAYASGIDIHNAKIKSNRIRLRGASDIILDSLKLDSSLLFIDGNMKAKTLSTLKDTNITLNNVNVFQNSVVIQNVKKLDSAGLSISSSPQSAIVVVQSEDLIFRELKIENVNTANKPRCFAMRILRSRNISGNCSFSQNIESKSVLLEIGGGNPNDISQDVEIRFNPEAEKFGVIKQGGKYGTYNCKVFFQLP